VSVSSVLVHVAHCLIDCLVRGCRLLLLLLLLSWLIKPVADAEAAVVFVMLQRSVQMEWFVNSSDAFVTAPTESLMIATPLNTQV